MRFHVFVFTLSLLPGYALAQFQLDIEQVALTANREVEVEVKEDAQQQHNHNPWRVDQNLDGWIFSQHGNAKTAKRHIENQLKAKLASFDSQFGLDDDQKRKLLLAGRGDIEDFFSEVEGIRDEFKDEQDQQKIQQVFQRIQPLQQKLQSGLFRGDSIMEKVSLRTLNDEQRDTFARNEERRLKASYDAAIKMTIAELEKSTPFTASQRKDLVTLLEGTPTPKSFGQYVPYYVVYQLSKNGKQVKEILEPGQAKAMQQALAQGQGMEQFLRQNGFID